MSSGSGATVLLYLVRIGAGIVLLGSVRLRCGWRQPFKNRDDHDRDGGQSGIQPGLQSPRRRRPRIENPERSGLGTKRHSMAQSFVVKALARTRTSRKSTRAVEQPTALGGARAGLGRLLRGERRVGGDRLGVENPGEMKVLAASSLKGHFEGRRTFAHLYRWKPLLRDEENYPIGLRCGSGI
jgi:hypothetical protein